MAARKKTRKVAKKAKTKKDFWKTPFQGRGGSLQRTSARWRVTDVEPVFGWAELSEEVPPQVRDVSLFRRYLCDDLKHIKVKIVPVGKRAART